MLTLLFIADVSDDVCAMKIVDWVPGRLAEAAKAHGGRSGGRRSQLPDQPACSVHSRRARRGPNSRVESSQTG